MLIHAPGLGGLHCLVAGLLTCHFVELCHDEWFQAYCKSGCILLDFYFCDKEVRSRSVAFSPDSQLCRVSRVWPWASHITNFSASFSLLSENTNSTVRLIQVSRSKMLRKMSGT